MIDNLLIFAIAHLIKRKHYEADDLWKRVKTALWKIKETYLSRNYFIYLRMIGACYSLLDTRQSMKLLGHRVDKLATLVVDLRWEASKAANKLVYEATYTNSCFVFKSSCLRPLGEVVDGNDYVLQFVRLWKAADVDAYLSHNVTRYCNWVKIRSFLAECGVNSLASVARFHVVIDVSLYTPPVKSFANNADRRLNPMMTLQRFAFYTITTSFVCISDDAVYFLFAPYYFNLQKMKIPLITCQIHLIVLYTIVQI